MRKGIPVSPGIAVGTAYCIHDIYVNPSKKRLAIDQVPAELQRYDQAFRRVELDLRAARRKVEAQLGPDEGAIFRVHEAILQDPAFTKQLRSWIADQQLSAQAALEKLMEEYTKIFSRTPDEYLRERLADIRDVVVRLSAYLTDVLEPEASPLAGPLVVVANELLPSHAVMLGDVQVKGIVTQRGSQTSHAAIVARSRGIPAVSGVRGILSQVKTGDILIVDGRDGHVAVNPDAESLAAYRKLEREFFDLRDQLAANRDAPALTADGTPIELLANINSVADAKAAAAMGASGVGLYRTEYLYLTHPDVPSELEQFQAYLQILHATPGHHLTIRTLDLGGDKTVPYLGHTHQESNPFLGWRSIRLSFEHPEFFMTQLRAILRTAAEARRIGGTVRLLLPMITTLEEMRRVRRMVRRAADELSDRVTPHAPVALGAMLEVPAAAISINALLDAVDFISIGSNDLVQYLMAADRDNPKVSHLYQPLSPAVLHVLESVIQACNRRGKPVTLCGEMAGQPRAFVLLLGMGLRQFSMSPAFIPSMKELARQVRLSDAQEIWAKAKCLKTARAVKNFLGRQIEQLAPSLGIMDSA